MALFVFKMTAQNTQPEKLHSSKFHLGREIFDKHSKITDLAKSPDVDSIRRFINLITTLKIFLFVPMQN